MSNKFWRNKKVLVTGYEGFLGSNLTRALLELGAKVVGLDIRVRRPGTILTAADYKNLKVIRGSVANLELVRRIFKKEQPRIVFHLAAEAIVGEC